RVRIGDDFRGPETDDDGNVTMPDPEELRLNYVAVTRAGKELDTGSLEWVMDYSDPDGGKPGTAPRTPGAVDAPETVTVDPDEVRADLANLGIPDAAPAPEKPAADVTPDSTPAEKFDAELD